MICLPCTTNVPVLRLDKYEFIRVRVEENFPKSRPDSDGDSVHVNCVGEDKIEVEKHPNKIQDENCG